LGVAFSGLKLDEVVPVFSLKTQGTKMTLMPDSYSVASPPPDHLFNRCLDLCQVLFCLEANHKRIEPLPLPATVVRRVYNEWYAWKAQTLQRHTTRAGFDVVLNVSDSKLKDWGFRSGDHVSSPEGERIIVGVCAGLLWHKPVRENQKVWFWSPRYVAEWKTEIVVQRKSAWFPDPSPLPTGVMHYHRFEELLNGDKYMRYMLCVCVCACVCVEGEYARLE
jgi:hypothetical protein